MTSLINSKINNEWMKRTAVLGNTAFTALSVTAVPLLFSLGLVWAFEQAPSQTFVDTTQVIHAAPLTTVPLTAQVTVKVNAPKALYNLWLTDAQGDVSYVYPSKKVADPSNFSLSNMQLEIPGGLKDGQYTLHAQLIYPFNPIKNGTIDMTLARVEIGNRPH